MKKKKLKNFELFLFVQYGFQGIMLAQQGVKRSRQQADDGELLPGRIWWC